MRCPALRCWLLIGCLAPTSVWGQAAEQNAYPAPQPAEHPEQFGQHIQRTMTLLATSTAQTRHPVKVLFYGQSITEQAWTEVARYLRETYPHADLTIENRAIGGFSSQFLVRTAEQDLYPFYPDLVIFHVYGDHIKYEQIIAKLRKQTAAEVAIYTDHLAASEKPNAQGEFVNEGWTAFMANFLPKVAQKYGCELIEIREPWKQYVLRNKLKSSDLLKDGIHLNAHGNYLLAEFVKRQLVYNPKVPKETWQDLARTYEVGNDVEWKDGKLTLDFEGNRVDLIAAASATEQSPTAEVRIDGRKPSEFPELYHFTRPSSTPGTGWPAILRIGSEKPLLVEDWKAVITEMNPDHTEFTFEVIGSKTGPDGHGKNPERFVSQSGRIVIEPEDWHLKRTFDILKKPMPKGSEVRWQVRPLHVDVYQAPKVEDPSRESRVTVAQGLPSGKHTLELIGVTRKVPPLSAIRVYRPAVQ